MEALRRRVGDELWQGLQDGPEDVDVDRWADKIIAMVGAEFYELIREAGHALYYVSEHPKELNAVYARELAEKLIEYAVELKRQEAR